MNTSNDRKTIYSIGTGARSLEEFLEALRSFGISRLADVRSYPVSRRHPHFSRDSLELALSEFGIGYLWLGASLGGLREEGYESHMETELFRTGLDELEDLARATSTAFACAETDPAGCHRRFIAWALEDLGWKVVHILRAGESMPLPKPGQLF